MKPLNYAEMGLLKRRHGITVRIQSEGVAHVTHRDGTQGRYAIEHLRGAVKKPLMERVGDWLAGIAPREGM